MGKVLPFRISRCSATPTSRKATGNRRPGIRAARRRSTGRLLFFPLPPTVAASAAGACPGLA